MDFFTADISDAHPDKVYVLDNEFKNYGGKQKAYGEVVTVKLDRNNNDLKNLLKDVDGTGKIVVVDAENEYFAVVGDNLAKFAVDNNYEGLIVNGYVRDITNTKNIPVGLFALGTCPKKAPIQNSGEQGIKLQFGNVSFAQDDYLYADIDGIDYLGEMIHILKENNENIYLSGVNKEIQKILINQEFYQKKISDKKIYTRTSEAIAEILK